MWRFPALLCNNKPLTFTITVLTLVLQHLVLSSVWWVRVQMEIVIFSKNIIVYLETSLYGVCMVSMTFDAILHRVPDSNVRSFGVSLESSFLQTKHRFTMSTGMVGQFPAVHIIIVHYNNM